MGISVCMATYNGEKYLAAQLRSILDQLEDDDELIIIDDCSTDDTLATIRRFIDHRVILHVNDRNRGEVFGFGRAMSLATNNYVFLADQDDIWLPDRTSLMRQCLTESGALVVSSNFQWIDERGDLIDVKYDGVAARNSTNYFRNIVDIFVGKTNYFGCAMAIRREFVPVLVPIPDFVESHDLWIALASNLVASNVHLDERTLLKRRHSNNATSTQMNRSLGQKLWARVVFTISLMVLLVRFVVESFRNNKRQQRIEGGIIEK